MATAQADPADYLKSQLAAHPQAGSVIDEFAGPDSLTGIVIKLPNGRQMVGYLTPSGRYLISGVVIDLQTNRNLTQVYAAQYGGKPPPQPAVYSAQAVYALGKAARITVGNPEATDYISVFFDPTTETGRKLMFLMMNQVARFVNTGVYREAHFDFIPYGAAAPELLKGSNRQRLKNLLAYAQGKPLPAPDPEATRWAQTNDRIAQGLKAPPPLMILSVPQLKEVKAVSFKGARNDPDATFGMYLGLINAGVGGH